MSIMSMKHEQALPIAQDALEQLRPHCQRCEIVGSIWRKEEEVEKIEILAIPELYDSGVVYPSLLTATQNWKKISGDFLCKYTEWMLPQGITLNLYFAEPGNWEYLYAARKCKPIIQSQPYQFPRKGSLRG